MTSDDVRLDWQRIDRLGIGEAIWGQHKTVDQIVAILEAFSERQQSALVTRVDEVKALAVMNRCRQGLVRFDDRAKCLTLGDPHHCDRRWGWSWCSAAVPAIYP